ncbi:hypothetical protein [Romboutsia ilealis]|uniref:hypothetical protein n=1 Tax=Romboutsia ilealis TaxID=1115758 RepID=UPI0024956E37|nr:hypothetical protein [Romboutsia ilealis]
MNKILDLITNIAKKTKSFKSLLWIFIILILLIITLYPILDANFLSYKRITNRIDILDKFSKLDSDKIKSNSILEEEYNSILSEMKTKDNNSLNNIIRIKDSKINNRIKFISGAWLFVALGVLIPFMKDSKKNKRFTLNNIISGIVCVGFGCLFGWIAYKIPTVVNITINIIIYQLLLIFLSYCIATSKFNKNN